MVKKLEEYFLSNNFSIKGNYGYGTLGGFEINVLVNTLNNVSPVLLHVTMFATDEQKRNIKKDLIDARISRMTTEFDAYGLSIGLNDFTIGKLINRMDSIFETIFQTLRKNEALGLEYCPICGELLDIDAKECNISGFKIRLDQKCVENINAVIENENKDFDLAPNNYLKGFFGALIGAIVGVVTFIIIFYLGFISAISAFVSIILGAFLYKKFGGKPNAIMIVIVTLISFISLVGVLFLLYVLAATGLAPEFGFDSIGLNAFKDMMTISEFSSEFTSNMVMTILFTVLGSVYEIVRLVKSIKRTSTIE